MTTNSNPGVSPPTAEATREHTAEAESGIDQEGSTARTEAPEVESYAARLTRLRTTGFRKLRPGCMHIRCYVCGRKQSNGSRASYDPPRAVLIETPCGKCGMGSKDPESFYFDAAGEEVEEEYCAVCGTYLDAGMVERAADALCVECADDAATDPLAGAPVLAVDPSRSTPNDDA